MRYEHPHHAAEGRAHGRVVAHEARDRRGGEVECDVVRSHLLRLGAGVRLGATVRLGARVSDGARARVGVGKTVRAG